MKKLFFLLALLPFIATAQNINADSAWIVTNYLKKEVAIPMRDGVKLFTSLYIPKDNAERHPFLLKRTPYSCQPYGENKFGTVWNSYQKEYFKEGYIMVSQDVRGRWMSEGVFVDVRPFNKNKKATTDIDEASDTYDTIDWLVKNIDNNNGNVGVFGISYPGFYSTMAALSNHLALKAVSPQAPVTDWFMGDDFHHNGAFMAMDAFEFYVGNGFGFPHPKPTTVGPTGFKPFTKDKYDYYLRMGALSNFTKIAGDSVQFWNDLMNHGNLDNWWKARNARVGCTDVKPAMLVVGGLFDAEDCFGAWNTYKAIEKQSSATNNKIVMGPWFHGQWAGRGNGNGSYLGNVGFETETALWYQQNMEIPFFNYYLKGKGSIDKIAEANIFFTGENKWRQLAVWPPQSMAMQAWSLRSNGYLSQAVPLIAPLTTYEEYVSDPAKPVPYTEGVHERRTREYMTDDQRFASNRPDVLVFKTDTLTEDITLAGPIIADLMTSISTTDADFVVKLIDVFPDNTPSNNWNAYLMNGYQMLVRGEVMRGKFRNSFEKPEAFVINKPTKVKYTMPDVAHTFKKGHRIMVQIQNSWFPLVDRNPQQFLDIYKATDADFKKATIKIYTNDSKIWLPIVK